MSVFDPQLERAYYRYQAGAYGRSWDHKVSQSDSMLFRVEWERQEANQDLRLLLCVSLVTQNGRNCVPKWGATANKDNQECSVLHNCVNWLALVLCNHKEDEMQLSNQ